MTFCLSWVHLHILWISEYLYQIPVQTNLLDAQEAPNRTVGRGFSDLTKCPITNFGGVLVKTINGMSAMDVGGRIEGPGLTIYYFEALLKKERTTQKEQ